MNLSNFFFVRKLNQCPKFKFSIGHASTLKISRIISIRNYM